MPIEEVRCHVLRNHFLVRFESIQIAVAHLGRDLEADVQQLPEARVVGRVALVMTQSGGELRARPALDHLGLL